MKLSDQAVLALADCLRSNLVTMQTKATALRADAAALDKAAKNTEGCLKILRSKPRPRLNGNDGRKSGTR